MLIDSRSHVFYLAGKITKSGWRSEIVPNLRNIESEIEDSMGSDVLIARNVIRGKHHYSGPFFIGCDHGCAHVPGFHGLGKNPCVEIPDVLNSRGFTSPREVASFNARVGIQSCDYFFAWIDSVDCYGTLAEIGFAAAIGKHIQIGLSEKMDDLWFATSLGGCDVYKSAGEAFEHAFWDVM